MVSVLDYAWSRPDPAVIKKTGYSGVIRYLSTDPSKNLSPSERDALHAQGLSIALVWETTPDRMLRGAAAGTPDGTLAAHQAAGLGWPADRPVYFACDVDTPASALPTVLAYLDAARAASGRPVGLYGQWSAIEAAAGHGIPWLWQTLAWSGGRISQHRLIMQTGAASPIQGTDHNDVAPGVSDWGQHPSPGEPMPTADEIASAVLTKLAGWTPPTDEAPLPNWQTTQARTYEWVEKILASNARIEAVLTEIEAALRAPVNVSVDVDKLAAAVTAVLPATIGDQLADVLSARLAPHA